MIFVFAVISPALACGTPASDLDGEEWTFQDTDRTVAEKRAQRRLDSTFAFATAARVEASSVRYVGEYASLTAYRAARWAA